MVSFWPFGKSDNSSAASFEKTLSQLSTRINRYAAQSDSLRSTQRRCKALWTLYASFAYILVAAILTLVTGWDKWGPAEYTALAGSPLAIYGVRTGLDAWYNYRLARTQHRLEESSAEREKVIERLKAATKYDSTQQLLDKYGGTPKQQQQQQQQRPKSPKRKPSGRQSLPAQFPPPGPRTGFAPPPTANIPARAQPPPQPVDAPPSAGASESFAPNAFPTPSAPSFPPQGAPSPSAPQYAPPPAGPAWYDRILDVVLGEDETQAKNRFVLICGQCRLVNGQAPPGARSLEDVGRWKCKECGAMNGVESEFGQVLAQAERRGVEVDNLKGEEVQSEESGEEEQEQERADSPPASSTRSKARQRRKAT